MTQELSNFDEIIEVKNIFGIDRNYPLENGSVRFRYKFQVVGKKRGKRIKRIFLIDVDDWKTLDRNGETVFKVFERNRNGRCVVVGGCILKDSDEANFENFYNGFFREES